MRPQVVTFAIVLGVAARLGAAAGAPALSGVPRPAVGQGGVQIAPASSQPMEAIDRELFAPEAKKASEPLEPKSKAAADPSVLVEQMFDAARRIRQSDTGPATQELQRRIVAGLEELLRHASRDKSGSAQRSTAKGAQQVKTGSQQESKPGEKSAPVKPGAQPNPGQAASAPNAAGSEPLDAAGRASLIRRVWGDLPERQRNEILQVQPPEEFLPKYEMQIEAYFKRLSEPAGSGGR